MQVLFDVPVPGAVAVAVCFLLAKVANWLTCIRRMAKKTWGQGLGNRGSRAARILLREWEPKRLKGLKRSLSLRSQRQPMHCLENWLAGTFAYLLVNMDGPRSRSRPWPGSLGWMSMNLLPDKLKCLIRMQMQIQVLVLRLRLQLRLVRVLVLVFGSARFPLPLRLPTAARWAHSHALLWH